MGLNIWILQTKKLQKKRKKPGSWGNTSCLLPAPKIRLLSRFPSFLILIFVARGGGGLHRSYSGPTKAARESVPIVRRVIRSYKGSHRVCSGLFGNLGALLKRLGTRSWGLMCVFFFFSFFFLFSFLFFFFFFLSPPLFLLHNVFLDVLD